MEMQSEGFQFLEDIATGTWFGEILFTAVEKELFSFGQDKKTVLQYHCYLGFEESATYRYLLALEAMGLLRSDGETFQNTPLAQKYLVPQSEFYQGHSILWRRDLCRRWQNLSHGLAVGCRTDFPPDDDAASIKRRFRQYSFAMNDIARCKAREVVARFPIAMEKARILDVGSGLAALSCEFLRIWPKSHATLVDMRDVMELCEEELPIALRQRIRLVDMNVLEPWGALKGETFDLILLSNIIHAFDRRDNAALMQRVAKHLSSRGIVLIHDFFRGHYDPKAAALDLNMLLNTYNGRVFSFVEIHELMADNGLYHTELLPLPSDTALIVAAKQKEQLIPWEKKGGKPL